MAPAASLSFRDQYQARIAAGEIEPDPAQARAVEAYAALDARLDGYKPGHKNGFLGRLFGDKKNGEAPQGLYVHGEVGRGKTMLMDLFFHASPVAHKRRAHFHEFMADVHERIYGFRQKIASGQLADADPVRLTAQTIFDEAWLLCFDEFHVTDIADAMILGRLFERLFALGTVVVATSNVAPEDLYKGGLNRALFLPFIAQIQQHMSVLRLDARTDFRLEKLAGAKMWLVPADAAADAALDAAFLKLTGGARGAPRDIMIKGRVLHVPRAAHGVARFSFAQLCEQPLAASDYLRLAHDYHTLVLDHVPVMDFAQRNAAKRFITLIDTLYDNAVKLVASADADPVSLYLADEGVEANEFKRTSSRLIEMGSESYLALAHGRPDSTASGASTGLVET
ncbi:AFG1 family ATPase [Bradyrhizobium sp. U87765 SZCCT0131]|uniref:cell division protein ZapE n=1 Tax=unclassified Bradyrhizobium TaxID=2631580 RepID=UPI001BAE271E|nr:MULTISPECIES: cell division protein ZapE [unclassified Bradyrhizobium]MBR1217015.1 AFG1 family ATPase [Bradyrhizobium sp. U87765 SZCCT0131]MBR1259229.1 AFG1 family ATPase [Bradyrhizobium sp. U87765 SZCCT0134]MBR1305370.1 AFG1 family ATPase [Bradyrhizobium sp. U87765 SZCCT0110]MBR1321156.1 AFG1 family ATPase [Bradyrhizobium sp. U87765 SZCCT0109]MBR1350190.1 AFG1 family ATPase [Bradyrhizobium sp. U87765 SZCCT0048]